MITLSAEAKRWLRLALVTVALAGIVLALWSSSREVGGVPWPPLHTVVVASAFAAGLLVFGALGWVALLADHGNWLLLFRGHFAGQLAKYVPGGVVQVAGLYDFTRKAGVARQLAGIALPIAALCNATAPGCAGAAMLGAVGTHLHPLLRVVLVVGGALGAALCVNRRFIAGLFDVLHRRWQRIPDGSVVPSQRVILRAFLLSAVGLASYAAAFATLMPHDRAHEFVVTAGVFLVAFTVGFLALPVPSGIGVREVVLVALLPSGVPTAAVLAASVVLRVLQLGSELILGAAAFGLVRMRRPVVDLSKDTGHDGIHLADALAHAPPIED